MRQARTRRLELSAKDTDIRVPPWRIRHQALPFNGTLSRFGAERFGSGDRSKYITDRSARPT
jgi:hypothetical protein